MLGLITSSNFFVPQVNLPGSMASFVLPGDSDSGDDDKRRENHAAAIAVAPRHARVGTVLCGCGMHSAWTSLFWSRRARRRSSLAGTALVSESRSYDGDWCRFRFVDGIRSKVSQMIGRSGCSGAAKLNLGLGQDLSLNLPKAPIGWLLPSGWDENLVIGGAALVLLVILMSRK
jgi:hypothetical protein